MKSVLSNRYHGVRDFASFNYHRARYHLASRRTSGLADLVNAFNARKFVLTVTAGRSGSDALTHRIGLLPDTTSIHEPLPHYRYILREAQSDSQLAAGFFANVKVPALLAEPKLAVAESNHLFGKGFFEPCLAMGFRRSLVFLRRNAKENAISLLRKNAVPARSPAGQRYLIGPWDKPYLPVSGAETMSDFQLCYWYCLEMHHRQMLYQEVCRDIDILHYSLDIDDLNHAGKLKEMAKTLELAVDDLALSIFEHSDVTKVINAVAKKKQTPLDFDVDKECAEVEARLGTPALIGAVYERIETIKQEMMT